MKPFFVVENYKKMGTHVSFEIFPPKTPKGLKQIYEAIYHLNLLQPDFFSVTYGAGGSTSQKSLEIASAVQNLAQVTCVAHFTCVGMNRDEVYALLQTLQAHGIHNVLALRGDPPAKTDEYIPVKNGFSYAKELVECIRQHTDVGILVAGYPEGHKDNPSKEDDFLYLLEKVKAGADGIVTQLFFDNQHMIDFAEKLEKHQVKIPIIAGIMPLSSKFQIQRIIHLSGASIPKKLSDGLKKYADSPDAMNQFGTEYAIEQVEELLQNGFKHFHFYTMNHYEQVSSLLYSLKSYFPNLNFK